MCSTLLGGLMFIVSAVNTIMPSVAAISTPTPNAQRSSVPRIHRSWVCGVVSDMESPNHTARDEYEQINGKVTEDEQRDRRARQYGGSEWYCAHDRRQSCGVYVIGDLGSGIRCRRLIRRHRRRSSGVGHAHS